MSAFEQHLASKYVQFLGVTLAIGTAFVGLNQYATKVKVDDAKNQIRADNLKLMESVVGLKKDSEVITQRLDFLEQRLAKLEKTSGKVVDMLNDARK